MPLLTAVLSNSESDAWDKEKTDDELSSGFDRSWDIVWFNDLSKSPGRQHASEEPERSLGSAWGIEIGHHAAPDRRPKRRKNQDSSNVEAVGLGHPSKLNVWNPGFSSCHPLCC